MISLSGTPRTDPSLPSSIFLLFVDFLPNLHLCRLAAGTDIRLEVSHLAINRGGVAALGHEAAAGADEDCLHLTNQTISRMATVITTSAKIASARLIQSLRLTRRSCAASRRSKECKRDSSASFFHWRTLRAPFSGGSVKRLHLVD